MKILKPKCDSPLKTRIHKPQTSNGFGLLEIVIATAIISGTLYVLAATAQIAFRVISQNMTKVQAEFLAEESLEAARTLRDSGFAANLGVLVREAIYYPFFSTTTSSWSVSSTSAGLIDGIFSQELTFFDIYRDGTSQDIVSSTSPGAVLDQGTLEVLSRVLWNGGEESLELRTYLTDIFNN